MQQKRFEQKRFCLNVFECVFPLPHTYTAKNKNTLQHDPARDSRIEHARSRNTDHCLKTKHFLAHAPLTLMCLCQCNLQYIRVSCFRKKEKRSRFQQKHFSFLTEQNVFGFSTLQQNRACSKQKHWPLFEDKTFSCACDFNTQVSLSM